VDGAIITGFKGEPFDRSSHHRDRMTIRIPDTFGDAPVVGIASGAFTLFSGNKYTISIPYTLQQIEEGTFNERDYFIGVEIRNEQGRRFNGELHYNIKANPDDVVEWEKTKKWDSSELLIVYEYSTHTRFDSNFKHDVIIINRDGEVKKLNLTDISVDGWNKENIHNYILLCILDENIPEAMSFSELPISIIESAEILAPLTLNISFHYESSQFSYLKNVYIIVSSGENKQFINIYQERNGSYFSSMNVNAVNLYEMIYEYIQENKGELQIYMPPPRSYFSYS
jgi:hypothetical protein